MKHAGSLSIWALPAYFIVLFLAFIPATLFIASPADDFLLELNGLTMGTRYRVLLDASSLASSGHRSAMEKQIETLLHRLDKEIFSTYVPTSQLSTLNSMPVGKPLPVSVELAYVLNAAKNIHLQSAGAFDASVKPVVDLWGFGAQASVMEIPDTMALDEALAQVDMNAIALELHDGAYSVTRHKDVTLDFSALAKGYAVDQLALLLESLGHHNYLVEIGGEVLSKGLSPDGDFWRVGIERPVPHQSALFQRITGSQSKRAIASSGSYQNFFTKAGQRYSHAINPVTGRPVTHNLISVTVINSSAMSADAWATALLVLGPEEGMELANALQLAVFFIVDDTKGFSGHSSNAFKRYL